MTVTSDWPGPFAAIAKYYVQAGWTGVLPLPPGRKDPVPAGFTGWRHFDIEPTSRDIDKWLRDNPRSNVALRLPRNVIGIDVDAYGDKPGAQSLRAAEERFGPLPPTWRTTSRDDGISGIRLYQVDEGLKWPNTVGPGIETIHRGHRYIVAPPSVHPDTGKAYLWVNPAGQAGFEFPRPSSLTWLSDAWVTGLTAGEMATGPVARSEAPGEAQGWLTPGAPCRAVRGQLERLSEALSTQGSRHDSTRDLMLSVLYLGQQGHEGVHEAVGTMRNHYVAAVSKDRDGDVEAEWSRMLFGAFEIVAASPRQPEPCGGETCGVVKLTTPPALEGIVIDPGQVRQAQDMSLEDQLFGARPELDHIRQFARARLASPWATLGAVLTRVVCQIPTTVVLPAIVGKEASINLFVGIVGPSGSGKQAAEGVAEVAFRFPGDQTVIQLGSGEGLVKSYVKYVPPKGEQEGYLDQFEHSVLFRASEVDTLAALKGRSSATLMPALRDAWTGDQLGFAYANAEKRLTMNAHSYRLGLIVGVQPERAETLLGTDESDGGTPQRFLWLPAMDPLVPDETPEAPKPWHWVKPDFDFGFKAGGTGRRAVVIPDEVRAVIVKAAKDRLRGEPDALDGHALLSRLKVAAALAFLAGRPDVEPEDWRLAGLVMRLSDFTRARVIGALDERRRSKDRARIEYRKEETVAVEEAKVNASAKKLESTLRRRLAGKGWVSHSVLRRDLGSTERRQLFDELIDGFIAAGWIETRTESHAKVREGVVKYRLSGRGEGKG